MQSHRSLVCVQNLLLEFDGDCGLQACKTSPGGYRPSTVEELLHGRFTFYARLHVDMSEDVVEQLLGWFEECSSMFDLARSQLREVIDLRDRDALRNLAD